jgi:hypothetical protein
VGYLFGTWQLFLMETTLIPCLGFQASEAYLTQTELMVLCMVFQLGSIYSVVHGRVGMNCFLYRSSTGEKNPEDLSNWKLGRI